MEPESCGRCKSKEYIPTHQFVKFDEKVQYLCSSCWTTFREWFFAGSRLGPDIDQAA